MFIVEFILIVTIAALIGAGSVLCVAFGAHGLWDLCLYAMMAVAVGFLLVIPLNAILDDSDHGGSLNPEVCAADGRKPVYTDGGEFIGCLEDK